MLVSAFLVSYDNDIMLISSKGKIIRCSIGEIGVLGRNTQGVTIIKTQNDEHVVSVTKLAADNTIDDEENSENEENAGNGNNQETGDNEESK